MVTPATFRSLCLGLPDTKEAPHFDRAAFRTSQRIYATLPAEGKDANLKLMPEQQELLVQARPQAFAAVNNAWGKQGWTTVTLAAVDEAALTDALVWAHAIAMHQKRKR